MRLSLPIDPLLPGIVASLRGNPNLVLQADPGAGKTTRVPPALLEAGLTERLGNHRHVGDIRGRGLFWAVELVQDRGSKAVFDPALKLNERVKREAYTRGLGCYPMGGTIDGLRGDHVILAPPYNVTEAETTMILDRFAAAMEAALAE